MRIDGWEKLLHEHIETIGDFEWGKNDCCAFAAGCINVVTGVNHLPSFGEYSSKIEAAKILIQYDGVDGIATKILGDCKDVKQSKRGDVVMFDSGDGNALGVCIGEKIAAVSEKGLVFVSMNKALKAWSV